MTTKERIAYESLRLFSENGYSATSVRDIAKKVGIKDSSLYNHFNSKQEIFDYVVTVYSEKSAKNIFPFYSDGVMSQELAILFSVENNIVEYGIGLFLKYVSDPDEYLLRKLLVTEMYHNSRARELYYRSFFCDPLEWTTMFFGQLMDSMVIIPGDARVMAYHFLAPIYLMITLYDCGNLTIEDSKTQIRNHIRQFMRLYRKEI